MILIDNVKYSCSECIRGHRSTSCRHHMRPLLQVRSKGRPNLLFPYGNKNYRIAVFAQEIDASQESQPQSCTTTPVVILKTSNKHVIDVTNGQILGRYDDGNGQIPEVGPDNFVMANSCCSDGVSKKRKNCKCNQKKVSRSKILRSYITKKMAIPTTGAVKISPSDPSSPGSASSTSVPPDPSKTVELSSRSSETESNVNHEIRDHPSPLLKSEISNCGMVRQQNPENITPQRSNAFTNQDVPHRPEYDLTRIPQVASGLSQSSRDEPFHKGSQHDYLTSQDFAAPMPSHYNQVANEGNVFQVINVPSCSIAGTCGCSSDCSCPSCVVHNNPSSKNTDPLNFLNNDSQYGSNLILKSEIQNSHSERYARELPRDLGQYSAYLAQISGYENNVPPFLSELQVELQTASQASSQQFLKQEFATDPSPCSCADNDCFCTNCETHGIIDGYKLDDFFASQANTDNAYLPR